MPLARSFVADVLTTPTGIPGVWVNVTPAGIDPTNNPTQTVGADPANPGTLYTTFDAGGIWKSTNYGLTWTGPVNTGTNAANITSDGGSGLTVGSSGVLHFACIRGNLIGYFRSTNGGVDWTNFDTPLPSGRKDVYYPQINPYNANHLIMTGHEQAALVQSTDGGATWTSVNMDTGMLAASTGTAFAYFINTGSSGTTATTWLWIGQGTGGTIGTWRTTNSGTSWTQVNTAEHNHGTSSLYQPNTTGDVFLAQIYGTAAGFSATNAWGVLHSSDYGATWALVGIEGAQNVVTGTSKNLYSNNGAAIAVGNNYETSPVPGTGATWTQPTIPTWAWGTGQFCVVNDGSHNILIAANWVAGLWRYIEP